MARSWSAVRTPRSAGSNGCGPPYNPVRMVSGLLIVVAAALVTLLVSQFMWWACRRSAAWSMAAGAVLAVLALGGAVVIAWLLTRAWYRG
jgi:hypothetical protein